PYLLLAGILAAGLPEPTKEDKEPVAFPESLPEALRAFEQSRFASMYLSPEFVQLFSAVKRQENQKFQKVITDWEREAYGASV
ncbi:MAG: glutamine synthetase, partial [Pseudomonadota bacterium]